VKSRWEPAVDEKVTDKVERIAKGWVHSNIHSNSDLNNKTVSINLSHIVIRILTPEEHVSHIVISEL
jgi:hypothetical protein